MLEQLRYAGQAALPHGPVSRGLHWVGAAFVAYGLVFTADFDDLSDAIALRREVLFALALGAFFLGRLLWITFNGGSRLPDDAPRWEHLLSRAVHYGIYASVLGTVLSGLFIAFLARNPSGGLSPQSTILDVHEAFATALIGLIVLHLCGAAWHWLVRQDGVWQTMVGPMRWMRAARPSSRPSAGS